jgi:hypothetical protein
MGSEHIGRLVSITSPFSGAKDRAGGPSQWLIGYIAVNPVAAGLCKRASDWRWGSHSVLTSIGSAPAWLAHRRLVERLEEITSSRCYLELVGTWERDHY